MGIPTLYFQLFHVDLEVIQFRINVSVLMWERLYALPKEIYTIAVWLLLELVDAHDRVNEIFYTDGSRLRDSYRSLFSSNEGCLTGQLAGVSSVYFA